MRKTVSLLAVIFTMLGFVVSAMADQEKTPKTESASEAAVSDEAALEPVVGDGIAGRKLYKKTCRGCHGPKGQGLASHPKLKGKTPEYVADRLNRYRAGEKLGPNTPLMAPNARRLSDDDIANIAIFVGNLK